MNDTRLTKSDVFYFALRVCLSVYAIVKLGMLYGFVLIVLTNMVVDKTILMVYDLEPLNSTDQNSFMD